MHVQLLDNQLYIYDDDNNVLSIRCNNSIIYFRNFTFKRLALIHFARVASPKRTQTNTAIQQYARNIHFVYK